VEHLKLLKEDEAMSIIRLRYVETNGIDRIPDEGLQAQVIDDSVLSGPFLAVKDLQKAVSVSVDGIIGPQTLGAISRVGYKTVCSRLVVERSLRLARHVAANPDQLVFLVGWLNRSLSFIL
jgi:lysozyme family protein